MIRRFLIAIQFLTRLPVPRRLHVSEDDISQATAFFPLVGMLVGGGGCLCYALLSVALPHNVCVVVVLVYAVLITHAFHEDGLADVCDGFGGGWNKAEVLRIMHDSRLGTYGTLGLIFLVLSKYILLTQLAWPLLWRCLLIAHTASRWTAIPLAWYLPYAAEQGQGKLVARRLGKTEVSLATLTWIAVTLLLPWQQALLICAVVVLLVVCNGWYYHKRLQGITGDCLGATNQLAEVAVYLTGVFLAAT